MKSALFAAALLVPAAALPATFQLGDAVIVRAVKGTPAQKCAANELAHHLKLVSGAKIADASAPTAGLSFLFAKPEDAPAAAPFEAHYRIDGNRVWFWGDETKKYPGAQFAVYTFLADELGVRWTFPGEKGIVFAPAAAIDLPAKKSAVYKPPYRLEIIRTMSGKTYSRPNMPIMPDFLKVDPVPPALRLSDAEKASRCGDVGKWLKRQRLFSPDPFPYGHAFQKWQDRFEKTHPEYIALHGGTKGKTPSRHFWNGAWSKLCVSNPGVVDQIIADWQAAGTPRYLNVCENDGSGLCECDACRALDCDKPGEDFLAHKTDRYLNFWNRVAARVRAIRPDAQITTYIYSYYRHTPRRERVEYPDNIIFGTVPSLADDSHAFFDSWKKAGMKHFFLRPNYLAYCGVLPRGNEKAIYDAYKDAQEYGLVGVDFDASTWRYVMDLELYVTVRMVAEPTKGFDEIVDEFCAAFGEAAADVKGYYARIRARKDAYKAAAKSEAAKANVLDDSQLVFAQARMHSEEALRGDLAILLEARKSRVLRPAEASRLDDMIVRAKGYVLAYRLFKAGANKNDLYGIAEAAGKLLDHRIANREAMMDAYEQVMNSRNKGTEGFLFKLVPDVLRERGGMTPREPLKEYN